MITFLVSVTAVVCLFENLLCRENSILSHGRVPRKPEIYLSLFFAFETFFKCIPFSLQGMKLIFFFLTFSILHLFEAGKGFSRISLSTDSKSTGLE